MKEGAATPPLGGHETGRPAAPEQEDPEDPLSRLADQDRATGKDEQEPATGMDEQEPATGEDEREPARGTGAFLYAVLLLIPIGLFLAPLATFVVWRMRRREPFVDFHGRQSLDLVLGAMVGAAVHLAGRYAGGGTGIALQWAGLALMVLQGLLAVWGMVDAGRGRMHILPLSLPLLRWTQRPATASAQHEPRLDP